MSKCNVNECLCEFGLELHHIVPKYTFPPEFEEGKKYDLFNEKLNRTYLCKKHHDILHHLLEKLIWNNKNLPDKEIQDRIWTYTQWFLKSWKW